MADEESHGEAFAASVGCNNQSGTNHDEWRFFVALFFDLAGSPITPDQYPSVVADMVGPDAAPFVIAEYPLDRFDSPDLAIGAIGTDSIFACPAHAADQLLSPRCRRLRTNSMTSTPQNSSCLRSASPMVQHTRQKYFIWFNLTWPGQLDAQQQKLSESMIRYWTQFAKFGDPNSFRRAVLAPIWSNHRRVPVPGAAVAYNRV